VPLPSSGAAAVAVDDSAGINANEFRAALRQFLTGVTIATTAGDEGAPIGLTANAFTSVSLDPPLVLLCVARSASSYRAMERATHIALHVLAEPQHHLSRTFAVSAGDGVDKFIGVDWTPNAAGVPLINGCLARLECSVVDRLELGDHLGILGQVDAADADEQTAPLGYFRGAYRGVRPHLDDSL
jgi:flavin reductase (DIM6/NTAB) family NADH-FMN oxidoreductase RutF